MELWSLLRGLGHPNKFRTLQALDHGAGTAREISESTGLEPSTVRGNLSALREIGLVDYIAHGKTHHYYLVRNPEAPVLEQLLPHLLDEDLPDVTKEPPPPRANLTDLEMEYFLKKNGRLLVELLTYRGVAGRFYVYHNPDPDLQNLRWKIQELREKRNSR